MKTVQETFIADATEVTRITYVENVGILAAMGISEGGVFIQRRDDDTFYFNEHPELSGMYDFKTGEWNMRIVAEFFTDATNADEDTDEFTPIKEKDFGTCGYCGGKLDNYGMCKDHNCGIYRLTAEDNRFTDDYTWEDSDLKPDCVSCGKPTGSRRSDGKYYCSQCWMEWNG